MTDAQFVNLILREQEAKVAFLKHPTDRNAKIWFALRDRKEEELMRRITKRAREQNPDKPNKE